jgi:hypothetical protein
MKKTQPDWGYYSGWIIAYLLAAGFLVYTLLYANSQVWCTQSSDEHCFREWISALSGWIAALVAVPSVVYLSRQIRASDRQHRTVMLMTMRPLHANAWQVRELARIALDEIRDVHSRWGDLEAFRRRGISVVEQFHKDAGRLRELIEMEEFRIFEAQILIPRASSITAIKRLIDQNTKNLKISDKNVGPMLFSAVALLLFAMCEQVEIFAHACLEASERIEAEIGKLSSEVGA